MQLITKKIFWVTLNIERIFVQQLVVVNKSPISTNCHFVFVLVISRSMLCSAALCLCFGIVVQPRQRTIPVISLSFFTCTIFKDKGSSGHKNYFMVPQVEWRLENSDLNRKQHSRQVHNSTVQTTSILETQDSFMGGACVQWQLTGLPTLNRPQFTEATCMGENSSRLTEFCQLCEMFTLGMC